jgi:hypothetical protein
MRSQRADDVISCLPIVPEKQLRRQITLDVPPGRRDAYCAGRSPE